MSELRRNPITGHWVIVAENRGQRPQDFSLQEIVRQQADCPFCEGQEQQTPGEVLARRESGSKPNAPGWRVRVVPNKYPALDEDQGVHEVIVESPRHLTSVTQLDDAQFAEVLDVYRQRLAMLREQLPGGGALLFKNNGPAAGATLAHLHSQLMASAQPTQWGDDRARRFRQHAQESGVCPACQMIREADGAGLRVAESAGFVAICPCSSRFPYETWVLPRRHWGDFDGLDPKSLPELAGLFRKVLSRLERVIGTPAYNYLLQTSPFDTSASEHYHWHIEILPRTTTLAGFELGAGCYINPVSPQRAAALLSQT